LIYLAKLKSQTTVSITLPPQRPLHDALRVRGHQFQLPNCIYKFHKQSFIVSSLLRFLKYFFLDWFFSLFSLLCAAVNFDFILILINFDFILYYNLLLCFIQLEMHVRLICAIKFYLLTYLSCSYVFHQPKYLTPITCNTLKQYHNITTETQCKDTESNHNTKQRG